MSAKSPSIWNKLSWVIVFALIALFLITVLRTAWISDDAYITFRSIENFIHGYGPVYNIGERVQTFTHPLWFFIQVGVNAVTQQIGALNAWAQMYYVSIFLSLFLSVSTALVLVLGIARSAKGALLAIIALILSKSFIDYTTSGLENALTFFLLSIFLFIYFRDIRADYKTFLISFIAGLSGLNRLDTLLFFLPALVHLIWKSQNRFRTVYITLLGFLPLILWELFSLFYYGFPFPNTAYAKLFSTGIRRIDLISQGWKYYLSSTRLDPLTMVVILASLAWFFWKGPKRNYPILIGGSLYLLYMFYTGGDFMAGRYFSSVYLVCVALLSRVEYANNLTYAAMVVGITTIGVLNPLSPPRTTLSYGAAGEPVDYIDDNGVADERAYYYPILGLLSNVREKAFPGSNFSGQKWVYDPDEPIKVVETGGTGMFGYQAGPNKHLIDRNSLWDPLIARMPMYDIDHWRIGHFRHAIPEGYLETLKTGEIMIEDPNIAEYYEKLRLVTRGDLFDPQRLVEIWKLNTGQYNHLIESYSPEVP